MAILYICDGEVEKCKNSIGCLFNKNALFAACYRTRDEGHARYGKCEGKPEWYPERFVEEVKGVYVEKERY